MKYENQVDLEQNADGYLLRCNIKIKWLIYSPGVKQYCHIRY